MNKIAVYLFALGVAVAFSACADNDATPDASVVDAEGDVRDSSLPDRSADALSDASGDACLCTRGTTETRATRNCGEETRSCASCAWSEWAESSPGQDEPECFLGDGLYEWRNEEEHRQGCEPGRYRYRICGNDCRWQEEYSECNGGCPGEPRTEPDDSEEICVPGGVFRRGCENDELDHFGEVRSCAPRHDVHLSAFYVDRHEVTVRRYQECVEAGACSQLRPTAPFPERWSEPIVLDDLAEDSPHVTVATATFEQAEAFCTWDNGRLLTGAEWERMSTDVHDHVYVPWSDEDEYTCTGECRDAIRAGFHTGRPRWHYGLGRSENGLSVANQYWFFEWTSELAGSPYRPQSPPEVDPHTVGEGAHEMRGGSIFLAGSLQCFDVASRAPTRDSYFLLDGPWEIDRGAIRCGRTARRGESR